VVGILHGIFNNLHTLTRGSSTASTVFLPMKACYIWVVRMWNVRVACGVFVLWTGVLADNIGAVGPLGVAGFAIPEIYLAMIFHEDTCGVGGLCCGRSIGE